jgi:hypothetical protein
MVYETTVDGVGGSWRNDDGDLGARTQMIQNM